MKTNNFFDLFNSVSEIGVGSYQLNTSELNPVKGFTVSLKGYKRMFDIPSDFYTFKMIINTFLKERINSESSPIEKIGNSTDIYIWLRLKKRRMYCELFMISDNIKSARALNKSCGNKYFYDLANNRVIPTDGEYIFIEDEGMMRDFYEMLKPEFMLTYPHITEAEYSATKKASKARLFYMWLRSLSDVDYLRAQRLCKRIFGGRVVAYFPHKNFEPSRLFVAGVSSVKY